MTSLGGRKMLELPFNNSGQQLPEKKAPKAGAPTPATSWCLPEQARGPKFQMDSKAGSRITQVSAALLWQDATL